DRKLHYAGRVGTGFNSARLTELRPRFDAIERRSPAAILPKGVSKKGVHWTEPRLVAEIQYSRWTADAILRHASFQGLREDKNPEEVVYNPSNPHPVAADAAVTSSRAAAKPQKSVGRKTPPHTANADKAASAVAKPARDGSVDFARVRLTNPNRVLYPEQGITKLTLAEYYAAIEDWALPHIA